MFRAFFRSKRWFPRAYGGSLAILVLLVLQLGIAMVTNKLNKRFYDIWADPLHHTVADLYDAMMPFVWWGLATMVITTLATYITCKFVFWWREAVTFHYVTLARRTCAKVEGASQRIQEDIARFTKVMETMAWTIVNSVFTIIGFVPILWVLSRGVQTTILAAIPGSLVWACFATSIGGFLVSWFLGRKLPEIESDQQKTEAVFRKELTYCEDDPQKYADETGLRDLFRDIRRNYFRLILHNGLFDIWKNGYVTYIWMAPFALLAGGLVVGLVSFGIMMQINDAFTRVNNTLTQFIQNWQLITETRSIYGRLHEFEQRLANPEPDQEGVGSV